VSGRIFLRAWMGCVGRVESYNMGAERIDPVGHEGKLITGGFAESSRPQRLKPERIGSAYGTAEAVPFPILPKYASRSCLAGELVAGDF
jgi:hypothetical protein